MLFELTFLQTMRRKTTTIGEWSAWKESASTLAGECRLMCSDGRGIKPDLPVQIADPNVTIVQSGFIPPELPL
jgi:hypothetical protein